MVVVRIYGAPTACSTGVTDAWRDVATLMGRQWKERFGDLVDFEYVDLFGPEASRFPHVLARVSQDNLTLPLVYIDDEMFSSGGKLNGPAIRRRIEVLIGTAVGND
jgi:disulfide oxidoreductase YuzD